MLTNVAVMIVLSIVLKLFGIDRALAQEGFDLGALLAFAAVFGFGGAIVSLLISKPWRTHSRFLVSHNLLINPAYADPFGSGWGPLQPCSLLILDEAHAPRPRAVGATASRPSSRG